MKASLRAYKELIDGLVRIRGSVAARRVRDGVWHREPPPEQVKYNKLLKTLSAKQRELLSEIIQGAADAAIHDVLVFLTDKGYSLSKGKTKLAIDPFDTETYYDFVARVAGDVWPDEK